MGVELSNPRLDKRAPLDHRARLGGRAPAKVALGGIGALRFGRICPRAQCTTPTSVTHPSAQQQTLAFELGEGSRGPLISCTTKLLCSLRDACSSKLQARSGGRKNALAANSCARRRAAARARSTSAAPFVCAHLCGRLSPVHRAQRRLCGRPAGPPAAGNAAHRRRAGAGHAQLGEFVFVFASAARRRRRRRAAPKHTQLTLAPTSLTTRAKKLKQLFQDVRAAQERLGTRMLTVELFGVKATHMRHPGALCCWLMMIGAALCARM